MKKDVYDIQVSETDEGIRIEAKGEGIKGCIEACRNMNFSCCAFARRQ